MKEIALLPQFNVSKKKKEKKFYSFLPVFTRFYAFTAVCGIFTRFYFLIYPIFFKIFLLFGLRLRKYLSSELLIEYRLS